MMMAMIIKILIISTLGITIIASIPELMIPLSNMVDTVFNAQITSLLNTVYSTIPDEWMNLLVIQASALTIYIIIRWFIGSGKNTK